MTKYDVLCLYETKDITMDILKHMVDLASRCGYVTVNQYLEMSGIDECMKGGNEWGWYAKTIMDTVGIKTRCGWILDLGDPCLVTEKPKNGRYIWLSEESFDKISDMKSKCTNTDQFGWSSEMLTSATIGKVFCGHLLDLCTPVDISTLEEESAILIDHAEESIQNYIKYGNLNNLKAARDILTTAIVKLEDEESEEK